MTTTIAASLQGERIHLRGPFSETLHEWYRSLPDARYSKTLGCWVCTASPATAWSIVSYDGAAVEADDDLRAMAHTWLAAISDAANAAGAPGLADPPLCKTKPWDHQRRTWHFASRMPCALIPLRMGGGKSLVTIQLCDNWDAQRSLILCPTSVVGVWRREFERHSARSETMVEVLQGAVAQKKKRLEWALGVATAHASPLIVVVNYESAWREPLGKLLLAQEWDVVICDESHRIKSHASKQSKHAAALGRRAKRRIALTGTPMPHGPADFFGQARFLDPGLFGTSFHRFAHTFGRMNPVIRGKIDAWPGLDQIKATMAAVTCPVDAVLDLPPIQHVEIPVTLSPAARKVYDEFERELVAEFNAVEVVAANQMVKALRLRQITAGTWGDPAQTIDTAKRDALVDLLSDLPITEPVVVFCVFRHELAVCREISETLGRTYGEISGATKDGLTPHATLRPDVQLCGVQIQSGGVGIDLTRASYGAFLSTDYSLGNVDQAVARLHRPGQAKSVLFWHFVAQRTIDTAVAKALSKRREISDEVMAYLKGDRQ